MRTQDRACPCGGGCPKCRVALPVQAKLTVGAPDDQYEREADRVADQVMRMPVPDVRRQPEEEDEELLQTKPLVSDAAAPIRRQNDEEELIQTRPAPGQVPEVSGDLAGRIDALRGGGQPLPAGERAFFEPRFGRGFGDVRLHTDGAAAETAQALNAKAYTTGHHVFFGAGHYAPQSPAGRRLLAHELTHVTQQADGAGGSRGIRRDPVYPDDTCKNVKDSINAAWPTAKRWTQVARQRLANPDSVASALQLHFKIDPNDEAHAAHLETVRTVFAAMEPLFDTDIDQFCVEADKNDKCKLPDGREFAAWVNPGRPENGIHHCLPSADVGFIGRRSLIDTIVHEVAHLADPASTDFAFRGRAAKTTYANMTPAQAVRNADSYAEFAKELFIGTARTPFQLNLSSGALLSSGRPLWVISGGFDLRSRSGLEVFDLVAGTHMWIGLDPSAGAEEPVLREAGSAFDAGVITRSAETSMFLDARLGAFITTDQSGTNDEANRAGLSARAVIGWADSRFRGGINVEMLFDFVQSNHAVIVGGQFDFDL